MLHVEYELAPSMRDCSSPCWIILLNGRSLTMLGTLGIARFRNQVWAVSTRQADLSGLGKLHLITSVVESSCLSFRILHGVALDILGSASRTRGANQRRRYLFSACLDKIPAYILVTILLAPCAVAQEPSAIPARLIIPDQTPVKLQLNESVSSAHARPGDRLDFIVVRDVNVEGFTVIPAGAVATGSVTGVKGKRFLGIGGNVALKLDSVELANGDRVGLHARLNIKGRSRTKLMVAGMIATGFVFLPATPVFLLTRGHDSTVLKSTEITAYIDADTSVLSAGLRHSQNVLPSWKR